MGDEAGVQQEIDFNASAVSAQASPSIAAPAVPAGLAMAGAIGNRAMGRLATSVAEGETLPPAARHLMRQPAVRSSTRRVLARNGNTRGGPGGRGPTYEIENGQVRLYRAMDGPEANSLHRFGDFNPSPSGAGKYFAFSEADARTFARGQYGNDANVTIAVTTVPKGFIPSSPETRTTQSRPYLDRNGQASIQTGEVYTFYDPKGGGWSLHVDDEALPILNDSMTRPRILQSPVPSVGGGTPPSGGGGGAGSAPPPPRGPAPPPPTGPSGTQAGRGKEVGPIQNPAAEGQARGARALGLAAVGFAALNAIGDAIQQADAKAAWETEQANVQKFLKDQPWLGAMVVFRWSQVDAPAFSLNQPGRHFEGIEVFYAETPGDARAQERGRGQLNAGGGRIYSSDRTWIEPPAPGSKPKPAPAAPAPAAPAAPVDVETDIGDKIAKNRWGELAVTLHDRFTNDSELEKKVASDGRLTGRLAELMQGALVAMVLWNPPNRVANAVTKADPGAARKGRGDYLLQLTATDRGSRPSDRGAEHWMRAARTLEGFEHDADIDAYLGGNIEILKLIRAEAARANLQRVLGRIDYKRSHGHNWLD